MASSKPKRTHQPFGNDQFTEIFSRMPPKATIKFTSLSKSLLTLLSNPSFAIKQTSHSSLTDGGFFIKSISIASHDKIEFHVLPKHDGGPPPPTFGISTESLSFLQNLRVILASSQGLVLLRNAICNPATRKWTPFSFLHKLELASPRPTWDCWDGVVFECHPRKLEYTIALTLWVQEVGNHSYHLAVYRNGRWEDAWDLRIKRNDMLRVDTSVGLFRGRDGGLVVHYLCDGFPDSDRRPKYMEPYMLAYDINTKTLLRTFKLPEGAWKGGMDYEAGEDGITSIMKLRIFKWRAWGSTTETVGLVRIHQEGLSADCMLTVWVLEDYEQGAWRRVVRKTIKEMGVSDEDKDKDKYVIGCCVFNGRGLAFVTRRRVYVYEMVGPRAGRLEVVAEHRIRSMSVVLMPYANTLRPVCGEESKVVTF